MQKPAITVLFIFCLLFYGGCWDLRDIDQRSIVLGVAFDQTEENAEMMMTLEIPLLMTINGENGANEETSVLLSTTGKTPAQMATHFERRNWRQLFFGHTKIVLISEALAREGIQPFIDFFDRNPHIDRRLNLVIAQGEARTVLEAENPREPLASVYLKNMLEVQAKTSRVITRNFQDSLIRLEDNGDAILPRVRATETELTIGGGALIKDWKLIAWLDENEARAAQFLHDRVDGGRMTVTIDTMVYTYSILTAKTRIRPLLQNGVLSMEIKIESEGNIVEVFSYTKDHQSLHSIKEINQKINQLIHEEVMHLLNKLQYLQVDAIGFEQRIRRRYPNFMRQYNDNWSQQYFPTLQFTLETDFQIRRTGILD